MVAVGMVVGMLMFAPSAAADDHGLYCEGEDHAYGEEWTCYGIIDPEEGRICTQEDGSDTDYPGEEPNHERSSWCVIDSAPVTEMPTSQNPLLEETPETPLSGTGVLCETDQDSDGSDTTTEKECVVAITEDDGVCLLYEYTYESYVDEDGDRKRNENTNCFEP